MKIHIAYVEDSTSLRKRFEEQAVFFGDIELAGLYASGEAALSALKKRRPSELPQIVLMDIGLQGMSGIETTIGIKELFPDIDVLMYTVFEDEPRIFQAIQAGASGYLLKDDPMEKVVEAIRELRAGGAPMSQGIARTVLSFLRAPTLKKTPDRRPVDLDLSDRELELLDGLVHGDTYIILADRLCISPHTVKTHIKNIYRKLHVHSRALAVKVAIERGLV